MFRGLFMRLCGFLGHACLLCNRNISDKNTEADHSVDHCRVLLWDGPADTQPRAKTPCANVCSTKDTTYPMIFRRFIRSPRRAGASRTGRRGTYSEASVLS